MSRHMCKLWRHSLMARHQNADVRVRVREVLDRLVPDAHKNLFDPPAFIDFDEDTISIFFVDSSPGPPYDPKANGESLILTTKMPSLGGNSI